MLTLAADIEHSIGADDFSCARPVSALVRCLKELGGVIEVASDEQYVRKPVGVVSGSLGGHVRHCVDHFESLLHLLTDDEIDYDRRQRGTSIETDRHAALSRVAELAGKLGRLSELAPDRPVRFRGMISADGETMEAASSVARELAFILSHTIHHNAVIATICRTLEIPIPAHFGYAPATSAHLATTSGPGRG